ncbi:transcriptional regulator Spx, partial [Pediococcus damnosus]
SPPIRFDRDPVLWGPSCGSARRACHWLDTQELTYDKVNVVSTAITLDTLKKVLSLTEYGAEEIISERSKIFKKFGREYIDSLTISELHRLLVNYPSLIKKPIIFTHNKLQVGFNEDEIRSFIPRETRRVSFAQMLNILHDA